MVIVGKTPLYPGVPLRPAQPGGILSLYGTGFGPASPSTPAAELVTQPGVLTYNVTVWIGGIVADVKWAGLSGSGLNQLNVVVPDLPDGDHSVVAEIGGFRTQDGAHITVQR